MTAVLAVYLVFALAMTGAAERADTYTALKIVVNDSIGSGFVTEADIARQCNDISSVIRTTRRQDLNLDEIERHLLAMPVVERANVASLCDGTLNIDVTPMMPVARIFYPDGNSYYINTSGKRVFADVRYHVDVPVVIGDFDSAGMNAEDLLPLLSYIAADPTLNALVSTVTLSADGDIVVIPVIRGQYINLGDRFNYADKFDRLKTFYRKVLPIKGWNTYDTISVKWSGQVVASLREKSLGRISLHTDESDFDFIDDISTMTSDDDGFIAEDTITVNKIKS